MRSTQGFRGFGFPAVVTSLALALLAPGARAQVAPTPHVLLGGGVAFPNGSDTDRLNRGYQLQGGVELTSPGHLLALRVDVLYSRFAYDLILVSPTIDCIGPCPTRQAHEEMFGAAVDALLAPSAPGLPVVPYVVVGAGVYQDESRAADGRSHTGLGLNGGAGLRLPALHAFIEARQHQVKDASNYLPLVIGFRF